MKAHLRLLICLALVLLVTGGFVISGQKDTKKTDEPDVSQFPILDYSQKPSSASGSRKSKKYNNAYAPKIGESSDTIVMISDWEMGLAAMPVAKSAAVIVGEVKDAQAFLSDDETNIYSEFTVQISKILKNDNRSSLAIDNSVVLERLGGRVRLPSGKVVIARTERQDLPRVGKRYVFFLVGGKDNEDFHILTGYELRGDKVFPLDKLPAGHPITAYTGTDAGSFFTDLNGVLADPSISHSR